MKRWSPVLDASKNPQNFHHQLLERIRISPPSTFEDLKTILIEAGQSSAAKKSKTCRDAWKDRDVQALVAQRRVTRDATERRSLSKRIL